MEKSSVLAAAVLMAVALAGSSVRAQSAKPAAPAQKAPTAKTPKVWTNDNIVSVRTASDDYQIQQEKEREAQEAAAKKAAAKKPNAPFQIPKPKTMRQADNMLAQQKHLLTSEQQYLTRLRKQVEDPSVTGIERTRLEWRLKSHTMSEQRAQANVSKLQADRDALVKKEAAKSASDKKSSDSTEP